METSTQQVDEAFGPERSVEREWFALHEREEEREAEEDERSPHSLLPSCRVSTVQPKSKRLLLSLTGLFSFSQRKPNAL